MTRELSLWVWTPERVATFLARFCTAVLLTPRQPEYIYVRAYSFGKLMRLAAAVGWDKAVCLTHLSYSA